MFKIEQLNVQHHNRPRRDYTFLETTRSLCSTCLEVIDAKIVEQDNQILLFKRCFEHGSEKVLLHSEAKWYHFAQKFNNPGEIPKKYTSEIENGCPHDCGICPDHEQHTCLGLIDITNSCDISCPTCFANSGNGLFLTIDQIKATLDGFIKQEGVGAVVQLSGGEPTTHPDLVEIVKEVVKRRTEVVMINTNGLRISQDDDLVKQLKDVSDYKLEIYLQFDGFDDEVYQNLRGGKHYAHKMKAIEVLTRHEIPINLACTVKRDVNENQIGKIVEFGVNTKGIRGVNFQPMVYAGRFKENEIDQLNRVTNTEIMALIEQQTEGLFKKTDFMPLPCSHPSQIALTYAYIKGKKVKPIPRFIDLKPYLEQFSNTIFIDPRPIYKEAIRGLWSVGSSFSSAKTLYDFSCVCGLPIKKEFYSKQGRAKIADENAFRIILIQFQDKYNWDMKVAKKCCIGFAQPDGKVIPFDTYNVLYRQKYEAKNFKN